MPHHILNYLAERLESGEFLIGQVKCSAGFRLQHVDDPQPTTVYRDPEAARAIALFTDSGEYRPLKTAPNLRTGWALQLASLSEIHLALDHLYPAAIGNAIAYLHGKLNPTPLRETLNRQSGMYAITKKLRDDEAAPLIEQTCSRGACLNRLLWQIEEGLPSPLTENSPSPPHNEIPLLCTEACCLLVGAARTTVKNRGPGA